MAALARVVDGRRAILLGMRLPWLVLRIHCSDTSGLAVGRELGDWASRQRREKSDGASTTTGNRRCDRSDNWLRGEATSCCSV